MSASRVPALQAIDINQYLAERLILPCSVGEQMVEQPCCDTKQPWCPYSQAIQTAFLRLDAIGCPVWASAWPNRNVRVNRRATRRARRERGRRREHGSQEGCFQFRVRYPSPLRIAQRKVVWGIRVHGAAEPRDLWRSDAIIRRRA